MNLIRKKGCRLGAIVAVVGAAANANAWIFAFGGTYTNPYSNAVNLNISTTFSDGTGNPAVVHLISYQITGVSCTGSFDGSGPLGNLFVDFAGTDAFAGGTHTMSGSWTAMQGTTINTMATGTFNASFNSSGAFDFTFAGQPMPEPGGMAVLGVGALGLLLRRRR